jgi:hypothetical protein
MDTYYARHTWRMDIDAATRQSIFARELVAVHYPHHEDGKLHDQDLRSTDPADHDARGKRVLKGLNILARNGGYILAEYEGQDEVLIGYVAPNTQIEFLEGKWGNRYNLSGRTAILKTVQMSRVKKVLSARAAALLAARPRQGTLMKWPKVKTMVENLVEGITSAQSVGDLSPAQQEIMCAEFLRQPEAVAAGLPRMQSLLLPVGSTLRDLDIYGLTSDGKKIVAQVTFSNLDSIDWKFDKLKAYMNLGDAIPVMFCNAENASLHNGVTVFPLSEVFRRFTTSAAGQMWLRSSWVSVNGASDQVRET